MVFIFTIKNTSHILAAYQIHALLDLGY